MIDDQNFEKAIRTKLVQHESDVPDAMWSGIESRLLKRVPNKVPLYRRIMWYSAAAIVMGVIVTMALWQYPDKEISAPLAVNEDYTAPTITQPSISNLHSSIESPSVETPKFLPVSSHQSQSQTKQETQTDSKIEIVETNKMNESQVENRSNNPKSEQYDSQSYRKKLEDFENDGKKLKEADLAITEPMKKGKSNGLKFGLMASNATSGNSKNPAKAIRTRNPLMMMSARRNPVYEFDHKMPLSVGATVSKSLAKNWELESGIIYTYLYSKYHSTNGNGSQELHYLGIPIDIIYRFARVKRASFYASAGGKVDFYLTGQQKDEGHDEGISGSGYKKLEHENVQFSVQAKLGAALTLYKQTELYLEPHIAYYIENNSSIHNIWKDKPFNFGLTLGIRTGF